MLTALPVSSNHISVSLFFFLIPVIILNFTSFRIVFVKGLFLPEKAPFKTGRIHGFSNRNAADDAEAVQRFCKRNSAKIRGLDRKVAFPTNRRNHGCKTELFLEKFADCLPFSPNVVFLCLPRNLTAALFCLPPSGRSWQNHIPFGRSFSFQFAPQLVGSEKAHLLTPSIINWELFCRLHERIFVNFL